MFRFRKSNTGFNILESDGFFGIILIHPKNETNAGTILRTGLNFGVNFIFIVGDYSSAPGDTNKTSKHVPFFTFTSIDEALKMIPNKCQLVAIEEENVFRHKRSSDLSRFKHPKRAMYIFGNEKNGLDNKIVKRANYLVGINTISSLNLSVCAGIVMYDRYFKQFKERE